MTQAVKNDYFKIVFFTQLLKSVSDNTTFHRISIFQCNDEIVIVIGIAKKFFQLLLVFFILH